MLASNGLVDIIPAEGTGSTAPWRVERRALQTTPCEWHLPVQGGGDFCTGNFSHEKISRRVYFAQWPEN